MFRRDRLEEGSLMVMEMASNDDELMWSKVYERDCRTRKATPPPSPDGLGQLRRSYSGGVRSMSSAGVCREESQVSVRAIVCG